MRGRGISTIEFLVMYGWAALVVIILAVTVRQMGVSNLPAQASFFTKGFNTGIKPVIAQGTIDENVAASTVMFIS